jgi:hypothetical protein
VPEIEVELPKKKRKRHSYCKPHGHIPHCLCPSCVAGRPERAAEVVAKKTVKKH